MSSAIVGNGYPQNYNTYNGQSGSDHGQNVIATGVLSNSDERHQRLQEVLGGQRQREYNQFLQKDGYYEPSSRPPANEQQYHRSPPSQPQSVQTSPRRGVFYRLVSPEVGLPLGQYEEQRKSFDEQRQRDFFALMSQKEKKEHLKQEEEKMKKQAHAKRVHMQQPEQKLYNYNEVQKSLREERRKDYDEFVPMGGIPRRGKYDPVLQSATLAEQKYREYLRNQLSEEESDSSDELDINDHSNPRKSRRSKDSAPEDDDHHSLLPWDNNLFEGKHTDEFLARGGIPRRRKQKYTRKSGRAKERKNDYMAMLQSKLLEVQKEIESQMKELQNLSGEEEENTEDDLDGQNKGIHVQTNGRKKLSKRKNVEKKLNIHQRGLQTPPWAEHLEVKEITTTEKIGHGNNKSMNLPAEKGILEEQPWYQNHQKARKMSPIEKEASKNRHEKYEPSQFSQTEGRSRNNNKNDIETSHDRNRGHGNQTDEAKLNGHPPERQIQERDNGHHQNGSFPARKGHQMVSYPEIKGQRSQTRESESHLWNNTRRIQYDKTHPWNKQQSQDLSMDDWEKQTRGQGQHREQGDSRHSRGHVDNGQRVEGHQYNGSTRKYIDQKRESPTQDQKKYENRSSRGQWDGGQLQNGQKDEIYQRNQKEEETTIDGQNFDDFMPFGGMLRRRKVDPATLKADFLEETRKNYQALTMKMKEEQSKYKPPPTPPGGLDVGQYELYRKRLKDDLVNEYQASLKKQQKEKMQFQLANARQEYCGSPLGPANLPPPVKQVKLFNPEQTRQQLRDDSRNEYNEFLHQKEQHPSPRRMPTPPNGLDIITQDERTRQQREKQRLYGQELQRQTQEQKLQKMQHNIPIIDRTGQQPAAPNQYNHVPPQQHAMAPPQQHAPPPPLNLAPQHPPPPSASPPPPQQHPQQHQSPMKTPQSQHTQMQHHQAPPTGSQSPPQRQRSHPTPQRAEQAYYPEFNGKQQSPVELRDGHRPPPHPRRYTTPDRPDWARGPPRQNGTPTGRSSHRRDDRQTPSYWNGGIPVRSPASTPSTRTPSTRHSNRTLTPKDSQDNIPDIHLESYRKNPIADMRRGERNREYNAFLGEEQVKTQRKREKLDDMRRQPAVQPKYDNYANSDNHNRHRQNLNSELRDQYRSFLSQNGEPVYTHTRNPNSDLAQSRLSGGLVGGIFGDVQHEQERRRVMVHQRNKEYNDLKKKSNSRDASNEFSRKAPEFGLPLDNRKSNELRRQQEQDRNQEYRKFLEEKRHSPRRYHPPTPEDKQGLPLTQRPYDELKAFNEKQRNMEYNQYLAKTGLPHDKMSLQGSVQGSALARQVNGHHSEMEQQPPQKKYPTKKHDQEVTHRVEEEKKLPPKATVRHTPNGGNKPTIDVNFEDQKAFPMGNDYAVKQKKLKEEWRKSYESQIEKVGQAMITKDDDARSKKEDTFRESWERSMESPPIVPAGTYDLKREQIRAGIQADYQIYLASQQPVNRSKEFWGSHDNPKIYPTSGEYKKRGEKMKEELREEFHVFMDKQEAPKERKKVFGEQGSVLFVSQYPDTRKHINAERKKEMLEHLEKKKGEVPRRQVDPSMDEKNMFSDMGKSQDAHKRKIHENAKQDYKNFVDHAFPEGLNRGEPSFAARKQPPDSWYNAQPPTHRRSPPREYRPEQENHKSYGHDPYTDRLEQARANEASYRRHDHEMNGQGQRPPQPRVENAPYALY